MSHSWHDIKVANFRQGRTISGSDWKSLRENIVSVGEAIGASWPQEPRFYDPHDHAYGGGYRVRSGFAGGHLRFNTNPLAHGTLQKGQSVSLPIVVWGQRAENFELDVWLLCFAAAQRGELEVSAGFKPQKVPVRGYFPVDNNATIPWEHVVIPAKIAPCEGETTAWLTLKASEETILHGVLVFDTRSRPGATPSLPQTFDIHAWSAPQRQETPSEFLDADDVLRIDSATAACFEALVDLPLSGSQRIKGHDHETDGGGQIPLGCVATFGSAVYNNGGFVLTVPVPLTTPGSSWQDVQAPSGDFLCFPVLFPPSLRQSKILGRVHASNNDTGWELRWRSSATGLFSSVKSLGQRGRYSNDIVAWNDIPVNSASDTLYLQARNPSNPSAIATDIVSVELLVAPRGFGQPGYALTPGSNPL